MTILAAMLPIVALIALGFAFGRARRVGPDGVALLNGFTVRLALPALLFRSLAAPPAGHAGAGFALAFGGGMLIAFAAAMASAPGRPALADRALAALAAAYSNTAFIGIPLLQGLLGDAGLQAAVTASILTVSALFALAILLVEIGLNAAAGLGPAAVRVSLSMIRNPLFAAPLLGALWAGAGLALPAPINRTLALLAAAASPVALVTIGAFLALPGRPAPRIAIGHALAIKLALQPAATALLAGWLLPAAGFAIGREARIAAILLAALPTGTGPFMLAELYGREAGLASRVILLSTLIGTAGIAALAVLLAG